MELNPNLARFMTEIHANIEEYAEKAVIKIQTGELGVTYPPNGGLAKKEKAAASDLEIESEAAAMALKKIIADAMHSVLYKMMADMDGVSSPDAVRGQWDGIKLYYGKDKEPLNVHGILNSAFGETYWNWVSVRKMKSPRLDNIKGKPF